MTKPMVRIYTSVDEFIDREMNAAEFSQYQKDKAESDVRQIEAETKAAAKEAAQAKLAALGLTVEDLTALGL